MISTFYFVRYNFCCCCYVTIYDTEKVGQFLSPQKGKQQTKWFLCFGDHTCSSQQCNKKKNCDNTQSAYIWDHSLIKPLLKSLAKYLSCASQASSGAGHSQVSMTAYNKALSCPNWLCTLKDFVVELLLLAIQNFWSTSFFLFIFCIN